jgi:protein gp37
MATTEIEWATDVWNPTTGCDRVSDGCDNCYALTMAKRLKGMGSAKYQTDGDPRTSGPGFGAAMHPDSLGLPLMWKSPRKIFVNSMSDLFHETFTDEFIARVFAVMAACPQHTFQILTKRHARMRSFLRDECRCGSQHPAGVHVNSAMHWAATPHSPTYVPGVTDGAVRRAGWPLPNVWMGVSAEDQKWADIRIPALLDTPAAVRWISAEPLLGAIDLRSVRGLDGQYGHAGSHHGVGTEQCTVGRHHHHDDRCRFPLDWVVVGGESGPGARPMDPPWARSLRDQCRRAGVPFLFKQWGAHRPPIDGDESGASMTRVGKKAAGRVLDGRTHDEYPAVAS